MDTVTVHRDKSGALIVEQHLARVVISEPSELQRVAQAIFDYALDAADRSDAQRGGAT